MTQTIARDFRSQTHPHPSFATTDPIGRQILIPETADEDFSYFTADQATAIREYYREYGYVVIRKLIPRETCERALGDFAREVLTYDGHIYRQTTANPERHEFTDTGFMLNPILNVQSLDARRFAQFRDAGLDILTHPRVQAAVRGILGEAGRLVQSMYFQGNPATWPHQDTYYLDSDPLGGMVAGWFAVEDIAPGAGRFFIYPRSFRIDMVKNGGDFDVAFNHGRYKKLVADIIREHGLECRAPALEQGDVLFWSSKTIHGSLPTTQPQFSRSSFTGHYIPVSSRFLQYQTRFRRLDDGEVGGMAVHRPKNLNRFGPRAAFWVETSFPATFQAAKRLAVKLATR